MNLGVGWFIYEWILRDTYRWVKVSKPLTDMWLKLLRNIFQNHS